jgi:DnaK suppressor protein
MAVRKAAAPKRRRRRKAAKSTTTTRKRSTRRRKKATAGTKPVRRRRRRTAAKKPTAKRRRRRTTTAKRRKTKAGPTRRRRRRKTAVKKKPSKSKTSKKTTSKSTRTKINRKPRNVKKKASAVPAATNAVRVTAKRKPRQVKSDSQALPVIEQQPSPETKMAEPKKTKKRTQKQAPLAETRPESVKETDLNIAPYKERPGEDYMSADQQSHFRRLLLQRKRMLLEDMGRTVHHLQDEGASLPDISDRATQEEEFNLELRARDRERKLIKKIEDALHQLDEGHYGFCNSCGVEIGIRRLEARPTATLCIDCKTLDEIREKQMGG